MILKRFTICCFLLVGFACYSNTEPVGENIASELVGVWYVKWGEEDVDLSYNESQSLEAPIEAFGFKIGQKEQKYFYLEGEFGQDGHIFLDDIKAIKENDKYIVYYQLPSTKKYIVVFIFKISDNKTLCAINYLGDELGQDCFKFVRVEVDPRPLIWQAEKANPAYQLEPYDPVLNRL